MSVERSHPRVESATNANGVLRDNPRLSYDPRNIDADLLVWVRADLGTTMNGATVSAWADYSGEANNLAQGTASAQPTLASSGLGGRPELTFDGSADVLTGPSLYGMLSAADDWTITLVVRDWTWGSGSVHNTGRAALGGPVGYFNQAIFTEAAGGPGGGFYNGSAHKTAKAASAGSQGASIIWSMVNDGGELTIVVNGESGTTVSGAGSLQSAATTLSLGHSSGSGAATQFWDGGVSEALIFDGALDEEEIESLESYLGDRYGIEV